MSDNHYRSYKDVSIYLFELSVYEHSKDIKNDRKLFLEYASARRTLKQKMKKTLLVNWGEGLFSLQSTVISKHTYKFS